MLVIRIIKKIISPVAGKKKFQKLFELLNLFSLHGMNFGGGGDIKNSGEIYALKHIQKHFKSRDDLIIFDVGAHIGNYSKLLKEVFDDKATIYSFEPSLETFRRLQENIGNQTKTNLYNFGLGSENAKIILYSNDDVSGLASVYKRRLDHFNISMNEFETVQIKTMDDFCNNKIRHIHLLKLDVEGNEMNVLKGASDMLKSKSIDFIQFEFGGCNIDSKIFFQDFYYLLKDNYNIYRIVKDGLYLINRYREMHEVFININYLAQKK